MSTNLQDFIPEGWSIKAFDADEQTIRNYDRTLNEGYIKCTITVEKQPDKGFTEREFELMMMIPIEQRLLSEPGMLELIEKIKRLHKS